jgi:hypothetical protein
MPGFQLGAEPYQRVSNIVKQGVPGGVWGALTRHQHVIDAGQPVLWQKLAGGFPKPALSPVAGHRVAHLFAGGKAHPDGAILGSPAGFDQQAAAPGPRALAHEQELCPLPQALNGWS